MTGRRERIDGRDGDGMSRRWRGGNGHMEGVVVGGIEEKIEGTKGQE